MIKILYILFGLFLILFLNKDIFAYQKPEIISRQQWGANEEYRFLDSQEWQDIQKKSEQEQTELTEYEKQKAQEAIEKRKKMDDYLLTFFGEYLGNTLISKKENNRELAWNIRHSDKIYGIVVHHTATQDIYENDIEEIQEIYKFHALGRKWGDIGYNFIIGRDGNIYEGRAGGEKSIGAHDKFNNIGNIGIALLGDYSHEKISQNQEKSLKSLMKYLIQKYEINLNAGHYFHKECIGTECPNLISSEKRDPIIGHRDAGHTSCPGDELYQQLLEMRFELRKELGFTMISTEKIKTTLKKISREKLLKILLYVDDYIEKLDENESEDWKKIMYLKELNTAIYEVSNFQDQFEYTQHKDIEQEDIKVKLSYPHSDFIHVSDGINNYEIIRDGDELYEFGDSQRKKSIYIPGERTYLEIKSWDRKPKWDLKNRYNDNTFRGDLMISVEDNALQVINILPLGEYLKGLGEVSNTESEHKAKTILISARTYAYWYMKYDRKFPGKSYDASDNPDVFQKYLGYGLEMRSPRINNFVEETKNQIITFDGKIIKPWYSSQTNGKTVSFYDYCIQNNPQDFCQTEQKKYPFLQSKIDPGSTGKQKLGHGVGISGAGTNYFSEKGWNYSLIIGYFLPKTEIGFILKDS